MNTIAILCVDDSEDDTLLFTEACRKKADSVQAKTAQDGQEAIDYLSGAGAYQDRTKYPFPDLILLDLKMPRKNGFDVLEWLQPRPALNKIPVAVLSSSRNDDDVERAYLHGAVWFLMKPARFEELLTLVEALNQWALTRDHRHLAELPFHRAAPGAK